ncbi:MAG: kinase [Chthoniobacterales bacterium]|nr:kinase [Chthoniobacterales bacterium]
MIISRTPYRLSFFGGGTDYPEWFRERGGAVLATSINRYCYLTCRYLPPFFDHKFRIVYSQTEDVQEISEIRHPVARAALEMFRFRNGLEIHHDGDLPARSGIGSSSAFTVGLLHALHALRGEMVSKRELASTAIRIERDVLKESVGCQDQITTAFGGFNFVEFLPSGEYRVEPVTIPVAQVEEIESHCLLLFTGISRFSSEIAATYVQNLAAKERHLSKVQQSVSIGRKLLAEAGRMQEFGALLNETWQAKKALSDRVSTPEVDEIYDQAISAGALGGKLLGAGGGGFLLLFVPPASRRAVRQRLYKLLHVPIKFESGGSEVIYYEPEETEEPV